MTRSTARPPRAGAPPADAPPEPPATPALVLVEVSRAHDGRPVWAPLDLSLSPGTLTVLTGPNGSGKTTLLRLAAGLLAPTTGVRECAGTALYLRGGSGLRGAQSVAAAVASAAGLVGRRAAAADALELLGMTGFAARRVGTLSAGERVRVALAAAVACGPVLLCLDEPTAVLDEQGLADLVAVLAVLRSRGTALLVATHQPGELLRGADAHLVVADGRVVLR